MNPAQAAALQPDQNRPEPGFFETVNRVVTQGIHKITEPIEHLAEAIHGRLEATDVDPAVESSETVVRGGGEEENMNGVETGTSSFGRQAQADRTDEVASEAGRMIDTGNNPALTQFYAEIEARASREATPEPAQEASPEGNIMHQEVIHEDSARIENEDTGEAEVQVGQATTSTDVVQVSREYNTAHEGDSNEMEMEVDNGNAGDRPGPSFPAKSALANLAMYNKARATSSPLSDAASGMENQNYNASSSKGKTAVRFTAEEIETNENGNLDNEDNVDQRVTEQNIIDAVIASAQGRIPLGGVTREEENRPEDVPRGLRYAEEEVRHGTRIQPIVDMLCNLTDPSLIKEAHLMLERGKTPSTYFRIDTRVNEHYERDLTEFDKESELKAAQIRRDREIAAGTYSNETVEAMDAIATAEEGFPATVPTLTLNGAGPSTLLDGSSDDKIPGVPQKKPQPSPVNRELRIDIDTLHPAQLYNLEMFRRKTLKEPPMEVSLLEYIATKSLRKRTPEPQPEPALVIPEAPRRIKAERDAEKAEEQLERERLAAEIVKAMAEEERDQPLPDDSADDAYDPVDERRSKRRAARGRPDSEEEDARYEMMRTQSGRRSGARPSRRQPEVIDLEAGGDGSNEQPVRRKRGRPPKNPAATAAQVHKDRPTPRKPGRPPLVRPEADHSDSNRPTPRKRGRPPKVRPEPERSGSPSVERVTTSRRRKEVSISPSRASSEYASDVEMLDGDDFDGFEDDLQPSSTPIQQSNRASRRVARSASVEPSRPWTRKRRQTSDVEIEADEPVVKRGRRSKPDEGSAASAPTDSQRVTRSRQENLSSMASAGPSTRTGAISKRGRGRGRAIARGAGRSARGRGGASRIALRQGGRIAIESPEPVPTRSTRSGARVIEADEVPTRSTRNRPARDSPEPEPMPIRSTRSGAKNTESIDSPTRSSRYRPAAEMSSSRARRKSVSVIEVMSSVDSSPRTTRSSGRHANVVSAKAQKIPSDKQARPTTRQQVTQAPTPRRTTRGSDARSSSPVRRTPRERSRRNETTAASQPEPSPRDTRARGSPISAGRTIRQREKVAAAPQSARPKSTQPQPKALPIEVKSRATPVKPKTSPPKSKPSPIKKKSTTARSSQMQKLAVRPTHTVKEPSDRYFNGRNLVKGKFVLEILLKRLPKSTTRLYKWSALPPIPDAALPRRPYDGLQEGGAVRRQMAASSEVDPMEDVDAALLNAASQQVVESDASDSPIRSKGKGRATYEEDEITVDFESEDGYAVRNMATDGVSDEGSKRGADNDMDEADSEGDPDFAQRFAFLK